jgi:hypothetical protein
MKQVTICNRVDHQLHLIQIKPKTMDTQSNSKWLVVILIMMTLTSCTVTITTHSFEMVPNTPIGTDGQFFYVKYGVIGTSTAYYDIYKGGGDVRNGLVADAKANLRNQHLLGPNQAYSNMSVDVLQTKGGVNTSKGFSASSMMITVVVETDIIEYGLPPENHQPIVQSAGLLPTNSSSRSSSEREVSGWHPDESNLKYQIGDAVIYNDGEILYDGKILDYDFIREKYRVQYTLESGKLRKKYVNVSSLSKPKQ